MPRIENDFEKVRAVILSCKKKKHIPTARKMILCFWHMHKDKEFYEILNRFYEIKRNEFVWF